jgi:hypothetical protein
MISDRVGGDGLSRTRAVRERIIMLRYDHGHVDSATALFFGAASASLGRGLLGVTFLTASAVLG